MRWNSGQLLQHFILYLASSTARYKYKAFTYERWIPSLEQIPAEDLAPSTVSSNTEPADVSTADGVAITGGRNDGDSGRKDTDKIFDYCQSIPVLYTNEPTAARRWIDEHLVGVRASSAVMSESDGVSDATTTDADGVSDTESTAPRIVGFDMESSPNLPWRKPKNGKKGYYGPATIQIGTVDAALVIQVAQCGAGKKKYEYEAGPIYEMIHVVIDILSHPNLIIAGVGIDQDLIELYRWCCEHKCSYETDGRPNHFQNLAKIFESSYQTSITANDGDRASRPPLSLKRIEIGGIGGSGAGATVGLGRLVANILKVDLPKSKKMARSPWAEAPLRNAEIAYASRDAWAAAAVLHRLSYLDTEQFGPSAILDKIHAENFPPIPELSERAYRRREVKLEWKALKETTKGQVWSTAERDRMEELEEAMKVYAPPRPTRFHVEKLGL